MVAGHGGELGTWMEVVEGCCLPKDSTCHPNYQHNSNNENSIYIYIHIYFQSFLSEYIILQLFRLTSPIYKRDNIIAILKHNRQITT